MSASDNQPDRGAGLDEAFDFDIAEGGDWNLVIDTDEARKDFSTLIWLVIEPELPIAPSEQQSSLSILEKQVESVLSEDPRVIDVINVNLDIPTRERDVQAKIDMVTIYDTDVDVSLTVEA